jgi:hypothetical protein
MEAQLRTARERFRSWLLDLDDEQLTALLDNWDNVMDDAALDRLDSWVIADRTVARLRGEAPPGPAPVPPHTCGISGYTGPGICLACLGRALEEKGI